MEYEIVEMEENLGLSKFLGEWIDGRSRAHEENILECDNRSWKETKNADMLREVCEYARRIEEAHLINMPEVKQH